MANYMIDDAAYASLVQKFVNAPTRVSVTSTTATSAILSRGRYRVVCDVPVYLKQGGSTITAATTDNYLPPDAIDYMVVTSTADGYVAAITTGPTGTLQLMKQTD